MRRFLGVALANEEQPDLVRQSHTEYLEAGAQVITTNTYR
jgi:methionine synthase I (cobalamin-dependent)